MSHLLRSPLPLETKPLTHFINNQYVIDDLWYYIPNGNKIPNKIKDKYSPIISNNFSSPNKPTWYISSETLSDQKYKKLSDFASHRQ